MATKVVIICDICKKEFVDIGHYQLIYKSLMVTTKHDICPDCIVKLQDEIKKAKSIQKG